MLPKMVITIITFRGYGNSQISSCRQTKIIMAETKRDDDAF
jgi:hypothetical protein